MRSYCCQLPTARRRGLTAATVGDCYVLPHVSFDASGVMLRKKPESCNRTTSETFANMSGLKNLNFSCIYLAVENVCLKDDCIACTAITCDRRNEPVMLCCDSEGRHGWARGAARLAVNCPLRCGESGRPVDGVCIPCCTQGMSSDLVRSVRPNQRVSSVTRVGCTLCYSLFSTQYCWDSFGDS